MIRRLTLGLLALVHLTAALADDGYRLWLRYERIEDESLRSGYTQALQTIAISSWEAPDSPAMLAAESELRLGLERLLGAAPTIERHQTTGPRPGTPLTDGYQIERGNETRVNIAGHSASGALYGAFALLRDLQLRRPLDRLAHASTPRIQRRLLNHWDNLNGFVERGYAGFSLWQWFYLPEIRDPRYRDYARALASLGLNGTVLNNVNANALILTPAYLRKVAALADEFRPWGVRVYLTARFSAPIEIGGLKTADPLDPAVAAWWRAKVAEIYAVIPDFGGFLVKANSEGQPGPQDYGRTHADGANLLADALAPHGGIVMWRAFVYSHDNREDRVKQAVTEFAPLDGRFRDNVVVQIKNGPLDFMPREPFSPLFGAMPRTRLAAELQITQEYLGQSVQLAYLAPLWKETLDADTFAPAAGGTVARIVDGSARRPGLAVIAGVANTGSDRNWTGHLLAQANWYAFGRLAWDHTLTSEQLADEWAKLTFGADPAVTATVTRMLLSSHETVVNYSMPLGLHHIMAEGHHYGPGPWVDLKGAGRADWTSVYYHRADANGLGFDRTATGSNALGQYAPEWQRRWGFLATCPENLLLWFHHVPWDHRLKSGRTLWDELCLRYQAGVDGVRTLQRDWESLAGRIDPERHDAVRQRLARQEADARVWRDACLLYFGQFAQRPRPAGVEPPGHDLAYYQALRPRFMPGHPGDY